MQAGVQRLLATEKSISSEGRLISSCELPSVGTGDQTWVLWKSNKFSKLLSDLSSLPT